MDIIPRNLPADDLQAAIQAAQTDLAAAAEAGPVRRDPYRLILAALSGVLAVFDRSITRWERAVADVIAARDPLSANDRALLRAEMADAAQKGAYEGMRKEAQRMVRTLDRRLTTQIGLVVGAAFLLGVGVGAWAAWLRTAAPPDLICGAVLTATGQPICYTVVGPLPPAPPPPTAQPPQTDTPGQTPAQQPPHPTVGKR